MSSGEDLLDEDDFFHCCQLLLKKSDQLRDGWSWESVKGTQEGFLRKTILRSVFIRNQDTCGQQDTCRPLCAPSSETGPENTDTEDVVVTERDEEEEDGGHVCFQFEFHVLFSSSYRAPVLYFRAVTLDGRSLSLEEVWSLIKPKVRLSSADALLNTITQQEHPLVGQVFFMLHPCRTQDFMRPLLQTAQRENRSLNSVVLWLSVVGPLVGLDVPLQFCSDVTHAEQKPD